MHTKHMFMKERIQLSVFSISNSLKDLCGVRNETIKRRKIKKNINLKFICARMYKLHVWKGAKRDELNPTRDF